MQSLRKRQKYIEQWEHQQEQQLLKLVESSQQFTQKQIGVLGKSINILLFVFYKGAKIMFDFARVLLIDRGPNSQRRAEAEANRLALSQLQLK